MILDSSLRHKQVLQYNLEILPTHHEWRVKLNVGMPGRPKMLPVVIGCEDRGPCIPIYHNLPKVVFFPANSFQKAPYAQGDGECSLNTKRQGFDRFPKEWYIPGHLHFLNGNTWKSSTASRVAEEYLDKQKQSLLMLGQQVMIVRSFDDFQCTLGSRRLP